MTEANYSYWSNDTNSCYWAERIMKSLLIVYFSSKIWRFMSRLLSEMDKRGFRVLLGSPHPALSLSKGCAGIRSPNEEMGERGHGGSPFLGWSDMSSPSPKGNTEKASDQASHLFSALYFPWKRKLFQFPFHPLTLDDFKAHWPHTNG